MQPVAFAAHVDPGLIGMQEIRLGEPGLRPLAEGLQLLMGFLVEAEDRAGTGRNRHLILEVVSDLILGDPLELRHIDGFGLEVEALLDRSIHPFRERDHKPVPLAVLVSPRSF